MNLGRYKLHNNFLTLPPPKNINLTPTKTKHILEPLPPKIQIEDLPQKNIYIWRKKNHGVGATIRISQKIQCLLYVGFKKKYFNKRSVSKWMN